MNTIRLQRWTVVGRETDDDGHLVRGATGYKRTAEPQEEREEQLIRFTSRLRVMVSWGGVPIVATAEFSLTSGRCIGHPDWVLVTEQLKPLRKLARTACPKEEKADDEGKTEAREEAPAPAPEPAEVAAAPGPVDDGRGRAERQRNLFEE